MWSLYDELIDNIPENIKIIDYNVGSSWVKIVTEDNIGISITLKGFCRPRMYEDTVIGMNLRDTAKLSKSWNFTEASIGLAAINAYYNSFEKTKKLGCFNDIDLNNNDLTSRKKKDAFQAYTDDIINKNVAVIGHFPNIEEQFSKICNLSILERNPSKGDYPDSPCEFILPEQDYVFITGMTLINKTLPRLIQITNDNAKVILVGPTVPMSKILFNYGITGLSGFCVTDHDKMIEILKSGRNTEIFKAGRMLSLEI